MGQTDEQLPGWPKCPACGKPAGMPTGLVTDPYGCDELECFVCHVRWNGTKAELDQARLQERKVRQASRGS